MGVNTYRYSDFNTYVNRYDGWYEKEENKFTYLSELNIIGQLISKKGLGLEVGVGTGRFASELKIPYGIDPAKESLKLAYQRGVKVTLSTGEHLPFNNETFDYVLMVITLSFFQDPKRALHEANRVLKREGQIIVGIVDKNSFLGKLYQEKGEENHPFYRYARLFSYDEVINLLKESEFENFKVYQTIFQLPENLENIEQPIEGHGKGGFVVIDAKK